MFSWIKKMAKSAWNWVKKHFHKAVAVVGAGVVICTVEVFGIYAADMLLLPLAMTSIFGLIALCFAYFLVIFAAMTMGMELFEYLWKTCDLTKVKVDIPAEETTDLEPTLEPDLDFNAVSAANVAAAILAGGRPAN